MEWKITDPGTGVLFTKGEPRQMFDPTLDVSAVVAETMKLKGIEIEDLDVIRSAYAKTATSGQSVLGGGGGCCGAKRDYSQLSKAVCMSKVISLPLNTKCAIDGVQCGAARCCWRC